MPYPSRVPGTKMWRKAHKTEAAASSGHSGSGRGRGRGRGGIRRRALDQQHADGQTTPKRSSRNTDDSQLLGADPIAPAPMKGLLASAANVDEDPEATPGEEESVPASPEASGVNGAARNQKQDAREKSPPLPKNIGEPDEYGVRSYNQRASMRAMGLNSRFLAPRSVWFDDWEIGFKDSSNDSTKGHTRTKRGKYLDKPNSNGIFFDHWCNGYDFSSVHSDDLDEELVQKHGLHPQYGIFLPDSTNDGEVGAPYDMPGKPVVYIAKPSGRISHASRSYQTTVNQRRSEELPLREKMKANLRRFCKVSDIDMDGVAITDYVESDDALRTKSLRTANKELNSRPRLDETSSEEDATLGTPADADKAEGGLTAMSVLTYASAYVAAEEQTRSAPAAAKPARYDAIRDVFTDAKPAPAPAAPGGGLNLNFLAELCNIEGPSLGSKRYPNTQQATTASGMDLRSSINREEQAPTVPYSHAPMNSLVQEPSPLYMHNQPSDRAAGPVGAPVSDRQGYPVPGDFGSRADPYKSHTGPPAIQDHTSYYPPYPPDPRDGPMAGGRGMDPGYNPRRHSGYGSDAPAPPTYRSMYWPQQQAPPPPPASMSGGTSSVPPSSHHSYPPPSASTSRLSFSQTGGAEPLPPLRPPRSRTQSIADDTGYDSSMRGSMHNSYYPSASSRPYHRGYSTSDAHQGPPPLQSMPADRILPSPQQGNQPPPFMGSPPPPAPAGYGPPQVLSPTFASAPGFGGPMGQSPPGTPHGGPPSSIHRHRSTPSGSSDAGNKYRKLQPAPVPAHRAWSNKPELKTIPYDHKETGSSAALPSSGPTLIRGWNVNQHRKRSKQDKGDSANDRDESR